MVLNRHLKTCLGINSKLLLGFIAIKAKGNYRLNIEILTPIKLKLII
jgi:hypothetical protein